MEGASLIVPKDYDPKLSIMETELAIKLVKDTFERKLARALSLTRVSAPLFVLANSGLNDNLSGVERPVSFDILDLPSGSDAEIVHSLAKWKRLALKRYGFEKGFGLYTDMNAIRRDETLDNLHSLYVDQWDWEKVIDRSERTLDFLYGVADQILRALKQTEDVLHTAFPELSDLLPERLTYITAQELLDRYPHLTPKEREDAICEEYGAVFISQIGGILSDGKPHDLRAPDYDDWEINGDILIWNPVMGHAFEISSMGVRVDEASLARQLSASGSEGRKDLPFHKALLSGELPLTVGGGIGQSRICMLLLEKAHIGEVQASVWQEEMHQRCEQAGIQLL